MWTRLMEVLSLLQPVRVIKVQCAVLSLIRATYTDMLELKRYTKQLCESGHLVAFLRVRQLVALNPDWEPVSGLWEKPAPPLHFATNTVHNVIGDLCESVYLPARQGVPTYCAHALKYLSVVTCNVPALQVVGHRVFMRRALNIFDVPRLPYAESQALFTSFDVPIPDQAVLLRSCVDLVRTRFSHLMNMWRDMYPHFSPTLLQRLFDNVVDPEYVCAKIHTCVSAGRLETVKNIGDFLGTTPETMSRVRDIHAHHQLRRLLYTEDVDTETSVEYLLFNTRHVARLCVPEWTFDVPGCCNVRVFRYSSGWSCVTGDPKVTWNGTRMAVCGWREDFTPPPWMTACVARATTAYNNSTATTTVHPRVLWWYLTLGSVECVYGGHRIRMSPCQAMIMDAIVNRGVRSRTCLGVPDRYLDPNLEALSELVDTVSLAPRHPVKTSVPVPFITTPRDTREREHTFVLKSKIMRHIKHNPPAVTMEQFKHAFPSAEDVLTQLVTDGFLEIVDATIRWA